MRRTFDDAVGAALFGALWGLALGWVARDWLPASLPRTWLAGLIVGAGVGVAASRPLARILRGDPTAMIPDDPELPEFSDVIFSGEGTLVPVVLGSDHESPSEVAGELTGVRDPA